MEVKEPTRSDRLRYRISSLMRGRESTWIVLVATRKEYRDFLVRPSSSILIDGYFRSANTFAVEAFRSVNPESSVAHHLHSPYHFKRAARYGIPAILLVRPPEDAVISEMTRMPVKSGGDALNEWILFYTVAGEVADDVVVATFDQVTADFASVIRRVNEKFHCQFNVYENSARDDATIFQAVDAYFREGRGRLMSKDQFGLVTGRPHAARADSVEAREHLRCTEPRKLDVALDLYVKFAALAAQHRPLYSSGAERGDGS